MQFFIFISILTVIIAEDFLGIYLSDIRGFSLRNIVLYSGFVFLVPYSLYRGIPRMPCKRLLGIIFLWAIVSLMYVQFWSSIDLPLVDQLKYFKDTIFNSVIIYAFVFMASRNEKRTENFLLLLMIVFAVLNILALLQMFSGIQMFRTIEHYKNASRFAGFGNPNKTSYYLVFITPLLYYFYRFDRNPLVKIFSITAILLNFASITFSGSRGGFLCFLLSLILIAIFFKERKLFIGLFAIGFMIIPIFFLDQKAMDYVGTMIERFTILFTEKDLDALSAHRTIIWKALWEDVTSSPFSMLFGMGIGTIKDLGIGAGSHNWYLGQLVQYGFLGLSFALYVIYSYLVFILRGNGEGSKGFSKIVLISVLSMLVGFIFSSLGGMIVLLVFTFALMISHLLYLRTLNEVTEL